MSLCKEIFYKFVIYINCYLINNIICRNCLRLSAIAYAYTVVFYFIKNED